MNVLRRPGWGVRAADDGLILIQRGARSKRVPSRFYSYMSGDSSAIQHPLSVFAGGIRVEGYSVHVTDMTNHRVPSQAYTIYLRATRHLSTNIQPVIFTRLGGRADCDGKALGLDWFPTSRWKPGRTYAVRFQPIETFADSPGTEQFYLALQPTARIEREWTKSYSCTPLWTPRTRTWSLGVLHVGV
jgi:hypothetical protein